MITFGCCKRCSWQDQVKLREGGRICLSATDGVVTLGYDVDRRAARTMALCCTVAPSDPVQRSWK